MFQHFYCTIMIYIFIHRAFTSSHTPFSFSRNYSSLRWWINLSFLHYSSCKDYYFFLLPEYQVKCLSSNIFLKKTGNTLICTNTIMICISTQSFVIHPLKTDIRRKWGIFRVSRLFAHELSFLQKPHHVPNILNIIILHNTTFSNSISDTFSELLFHKSYSCRPFYLDGFLILP